MNSWMVDMADTFTRCFIREDRYKLLISGIGVTIKVSIVAVILGILIGFLIALCNLSKNKFLRAIGKIYTDIIRGTPSVTQLMIIYFVIFATVDIEKWIIAEIAFGINSGAYVSEIIRAGIQSIDQGQTEAARSLGLSQTMNLRYIILPQALKNILPAIANEFVVIIKESASTNTIGVQDIMSAVNAVKGATFIIIEPLLVATAIYFCLCFPTSKLIAYFERRMSHGDKR